MLSDNAIAFSDYEEGIDIPGTIGKRVKTCLHISEDGESAGILPKFMTAGAACADVAVPDRIYISPQSSVKIDLLVSFDIPEGYKIVMYPRSSLLVKKGLLSPVSIIDSDYKGHVHVVLSNITNKGITLEKGERVAQIELQSVIKGIWPTVNQSRDQKGFGGTGTI